MATYPSNKRRTNYARLCCAIIDLGADVLRTILRRQVLPAHVHNDIRSCAEPDRRSAGLKPNQWKCINNAATVGSYKEFDITLLCQVLRLLSVHDLRNTLGQQINPKDIDKKVQNCPALTADLGTKLTHDECLSVRHSATYGSYENCKDELLWKLFKYLCPSPYLNMHPTLSWGIHNMPHPSHLTLGDDIERIRVMRNTVYGHISTTEMSDEDFNDNWTCLEDIMTRMDKHLSSGNYKQLLDDIKTKSMDETFEKFFCDEMKKLADNEKEIHTEIQALKVEVGTQKRSLEKIEAQTSQLQSDAKKIKTNNEKHEQVLLGCKTEIANLTKSTNESFEEMKSGFESLKQCTENVMTSESANKLTGETRATHENTLAMINEHKKDKTFYVRQCVKSGIEVLKEEGIMILTGKGGDGKTKCSLEIMKQIYEEDKEYVVLDIENVDKWDELVSAERKTLVRIDDPIGKSNTDSTLFKKCERYWDKIYACVKSGKTKVILTIRGCILKENQQDLQKYGLFDECHRVDLSSYVNNVIEKREMFKLHCKQNNIDLCSSKKDENYESEAALSKSVRVNILDIRVDAIVETDPIIGFPQACFLFCKKRKYTRLGISFFRHPNESLIKSLKSMRESSDHREKMRYCIMSYMILNDGVVDFEHLDYDKLRKVKESIDLKGNYKDYQYEDAIEDIVDLYICKKSIKHTEDDLFDSDSELDGDAWRLPYLSFDSMFIKDSGKVCTVSKYLVNDDYESTYSASLEDDPPRLSDGDEEDECKKELSYCFSHETIVEAVAITFSVCNLELLLELCPWRIIGEFVRQNTYRAKENEVAIKIKPTYYNLLAKRIAMEIRKESFDWLTHPILNHEAFFEHLINSDDFISSVHAGFECVFVEMCKHGITSLLNWVWKNCKNDLVSIDLSCCMKRVSSKATYTLAGVVWMLENVLDLKEDCVIDSVINCIARDKISEQLTATNVMSVILKSEEYRRIVSKNSEDNHNIFTTALICGRTQWLDILWKHFRIELQSNDLENIFQNVFDFGDISVRFCNRLKGILWLMENFDDTNNSTFLEKLSNYYLDCSNSKLASEFVEAIANKCMNEDHIRNLFISSFLKQNVELIDILWRKFKPMLSFLNMTPTINSIVGENYFNRTSNFWPFRSRPNCNSEKWLLQNVPGISTESVEKALLDIVESDDVFFPSDFCHVLDEYKQVASDSCSKYNGMFITACELNNSDYMDFLWDRFPSSILSSDISEHLVTSCNRQTDPLFDIFPKPSLTAKLLYGY